MRHLLDILKIGPGHIIKLATYMVDGTFPSSLPFSIISKEKRDG